SHVICVLLLTYFAGCTHDRNFEIKTLDVGETVNLTCPRQTTWYSASVFWIRLFPGNLPEFLGGTYSFDYNAVNKTPRITTKQEPGAFVLEIKEADLGDSGFYYYITVVTKDFPSDPIQPGSSVTLQCSVLTDYKKCSGEHGIFWFKDGLNESNPSYLYTQRNSDGECVWSLEAHGSQTCYYTFSDFTSSDAGTYYCAVAACGKIIIGNGTKLDIEGNRQDGCNDDTQSSPKSCLHHFSKTIHSSDAGTSYYYCAVDTCGRILFEKRTRMQIGMFLGSYTKNFNTMADTFLFFNKIMDILFVPQVEDEDQMNYTGLDFSAKHPTRGRTKEELHEESFYSQVTIQH
uniref:Ig-like domain-containing protein n=1 Tax=Sphaeramia orbicularis TaxID=375764 RepID=A0A672ZR48_9TELE